MYKVSDELMNQALNCIALAIHPNKQYIEVQTLVNQLAQCKTLPKKRKAE